MFNALLAIRQAHARIKYRVQHVDKQVGEPDDGGIHQCDGHQHRIILILDGGDEIAADAWHLVDGFDKERAGDQVSQGDTGHRHHRDQSVGQRVTVEDDPLAESFGARGADVVLTQFFQHGGAHHAGEDRSQSSAHGDGGKHQVGESSAVRLARFRPTGPQERAEKSEPRKASSSRLALLLQCIKPYMR